MILPKLAHITSRKTLTAHNFNFENRLTQFSKYSTTQMNRSNRIKTPQSFRAPNLQI